MPSFAQPMVDEKYIDEQLSKMNEYTLLIWSRSTTKAPKDSVESWKKGHLKIIFQLQEDRKVSFFGAVSGEPSMVGIIVFNTTDTDAVKKQIEKDPFILNNFLTYKLCKWYSVPNQMLLPSSTEKK